MPKYWLIKSEPETYGIDHLAKDKREPWTGVRNYQARNNMRDLMKIGDKALFYHSNAKPSGVIGLAEVVSEPYPDPSAFDPKSEYFDPKSSLSKPTWILVDMGFVEKFPRLVSLEEMKQDPALEGMIVTRKGSRLSVQPVSKEHFDHVVALAKRK